MLNLRPYQTKAVAAIESELAGATQKLLVVSPTGSGKCLGPSTPVLRFDGGVVRADEVRTGDMLMGPDSKPRTVIGTTTGIGPMFRIVPTKGEAWTCNDVHVLTLQNTTTGRIIDIPLNEYLGKNATFKHEFKLFQAPVDFEANHLPLDPYFLGVWFGDGTKLLSGVGISKPDPEIRQLCEDMAVAYGLTVRTSISNHGGCPTHHIVTVRGRKNPLLDAIRAVAGNGGEDVRVPMAYLTGSREQRAAFLAGWLDSDGYMHHGGYEICQLRKDWADAISYLARSLGFRVSRSIKTVNGTEYQRMSISGDASWLPLRIPRKKAEPRKQKKNVLRTGFKVEDIGVGQYAGFELNGDGRFLLGDFTVTHNTVVASALIDRVVAAGGQVLFMAHRRELIDQTSRKLEQFGVRHGVIMANHGRWMPFLPVQVASVQTLVQRIRNRPGVLAQFSPTLIIVDEAHRALAPTYRDCYAHWSQAKILGLTATPWTNTGKGLGHYFQKSYLAASVQQLVDEGALVPCDGFGYEQPDLTGVKTIAGDYSEQQLDTRLNKQAVIGGYVERWLQFSPGKRTVAFAVSVSHSKHIAEAFRAKGVAAEHLDGEMPIAERDAILRRLRSGETLVVSNCAVLCEGWDDPSVEVCIMARPTKSLALFLQCAGRILRPHCFDCGKPTPWTGEACVHCGSVDGVKRTGRLHDHAGTLLQHGVPEEQRDYSLQADMRKKGPTSSVVSVTFCPECFRPMKSGTLRCDKCGWSKPAPEEKPVKEQDEGRVLSMEEIRALRGAPRSTQAAEYKRMIDDCRRAGTGGAMIKFKAVFGHWPKFTPAEMKGADSKVAQLGMRVLLKGG